MTRFPKKGSDFSQNQGQNSNVSNTARTGFQNLRSLAKPRRAKSAIVSKRYCTDLWTSEISLDTRNNSSSHGQGQQKLKVSSASLNLDKGQTLNPTKMDDPCCEHRPGEELLRSCVGTKQKMISQNRIRSIRLGRSLDAGAVKFKDISRLISHQFANFRARDIKQVGLTRCAGFCMTAVITGVAETGLVDSGVLLNSVFFHQGAHKTTTEALLLDLHQREITKNILHASVQRSAIGLQQRVFGLSHPHIDDLARPNCI